MEQLARLRGRSNYRIDYLHIIDWLVRNPGAFVSYRYREHLFPNSRFRMAYDLLQATMPAHCDRRYLQILELAAKRRPKDPCATRYGSHISKKRRWVRRS